MIIPMCCFTCGKSISGKWNRYLAESNRINYDKTLSANEKIKRQEKLLISLGLKRYCCRRMLITNVDMTEKIIM